MKGIILESKRYCVYLHRRKDNNEVFYVGHGTERRPRASCKYTRSKMWLRAVETAGGFIPEIYKDGLTKQEAIELEVIVASEYSNLVNGKITSPRDYPTIEHFSKYFAYCEDSPSGLISLKTGKPCGTRKHNNNNKSYWIVYNNKTHYRASRIICILHAIYIDKTLVVDHINGDSLDNRISNLRVCTQAENSENVNTKKSETQGVKFIKRDQRWVAQWQENYKQKEKGFPVKKYGYEEAKRLAIEYRNLMVSRKES